MELNKLKANLENPEFYKKHVKGFFLFSFWKKTYKTYREAEKKSIVPNYLLREDTHEDSFYNTYALSVDGAIDEATLQEITAQIKALDLGTIRYLSHGTNGFFPLVDENGVCVEETNIDINGKGIYVYAVSDFKKRHC